MTETLPTINPIPTYTPPTNSQPAPTTLPTIQQLFSETWQIMTQSILKLFGTDILTGLLQLVILAIFVFYSWNIIGLNFEMITNPDKTKLMELVPTIPTHYGQLGLGFIAFIVLSIATAIAKSIVHISILGNKPETKFGDHLKSAIRLIVPVFILGIITNILVIGGMFLLIIPSIIISMFLIFASLEIILGKQTIFSALANSVRIVGQHFGDIFIRFFALTFIYIIVLIFIPNAITKIDPASGILIQTLRFLLQVFSTWYGTAFLVKLYQHTQANTDKSKPANMGWIIFLSAFGWLIAFLLGYAFIKNNGPEYLKSNFMEGFNSSFNPKSAQADFTKAPSSCGISIPVPATSDQKDGLTRKWLFEEIALSPDNFYVLDKDTYPNEKVLGAFVAFKDETNRLGGESFSVGYPGLNVYCVENTKKLTLDEFVGLVKTNKAYTVEVGEKYNWGEVEATAIVLKQFDQKGEQTFNDIGNLAVSKDGNRLIYFRRWGIDEKDPSKEILEKDSQTISGNLSYKEVPVELILPADPKATTTPKKTTSGGSTTTSGCKTLPIPSGEFASNKCYSTSDYNELNGYLRSFNDAAFIYNGAAGKANVVCNGFTESFAQQCEQAKKDMESSKASMEGFRNAINAVIARGK